MTHTCNICGTTSDVTPFYSGVTSRCKECHKAKVKENRDANADYYREYDARRFQDDPRVRARHAAYRATDAGISSIRASQQKWNSQNPEKRSAHLILNNAVRDGRVMKPDKCEKCGAGGRIHGHHSDYTRPVDVMWLCQTCHWAEHKEEWKAR